MERGAELRKRADASLTAQRVEQEMESDAEKEVKTLLSKLFSRLHALASVKIINNSQENSEEAMVTRHNVKEIVAVKAVSCAVSYGYMLAPHEFFHVKKVDAKASAELNKHEREARQQKHKSRGADQQKVHASHE